MKRFPTEDFSARYQQVFGCNEPFLRFSNPANVANSLLDGNRDHLLAEARFELMKQEHKVESLNTCISKLLRQTYSQGYVPVNRQSFQVLDLR